MLLTLMLALAAAPEPGLLAWYPCDEGAGEVLHDRSGNGHDGVIEGCAWGSYGDRASLVFDGRDDRVVLGDDAALNPTAAISLSLWVLPEAVPAGEAGIVGKDYGSYVLTLYTDGRCWWYIGGGGNNVSADLPLGQWHHVVATFDGEMLRLYVDGRESAARSKLNTVPVGRQLLMGTSTGAEQYTKGAHFRGQLHDVRLYDRALSAEEVRRQYRTGHVTGRVEVKAHPMPYARELLVDLDLRGLGELPAGAELELQVKRADGAVVASQRLPAPVEPAVVVRLPLGDARPGAHELHTRVSAAGRELGTPVAQPFDWPTTPPERLNNLVQRLLRAEGAGERRFTVPRDGWIWVGWSGDAPLVDGRPLVPLDGASEAMFRLPAGEHRLSMGDATPRAEVRQVPELLFAQWGAHPHVREYGRYDWDFLARDVLPNLNVMVGPGANAAGEAITRWRAAGRVWLGTCPLPGISGPITAAEAETFWRAQPGWADPLLAGSLVDEFFGQDEAHYQAWTEALERLAADPALAGKALYPYCGLIVGSPWQQRFCRAVMDHGGKFAFERYLPEPPNETAGWRSALHNLAGAVDAWRRGLPGSEQALIVVLGTFSQPPESLDVDPAVNYQVFLDRQLYILANDPRCADLYGVMTYLSSYTDEETVRWCGRLFRHYGIEGQTTPLTADPFELTHLANPDFLTGLDGWTVEAAEPGAVAPAIVDGFGWLQGRYPDPQLGRHAVRLRRSERGPNAISQTVRGLEPGRTYSLRFYSCAPEELGTEQRLGLDVSLAPAEIMADRSFQHVFANCYSHHFGPYDNQNRAWMNYHWVVFRATAPEAVLRISDWRDGQAAGPAGQELALNFVQVQPYRLPE